MPEDRGPGTAGDIEPRASEVPAEGDERLHICVGAVCNNNCVFCMEDDREARRARLGSQTPEDVARMILRGGRGAREVLFTTGEPTLDPHLPAYVRCAALAGYDVIGLISNGRRLAHLPYLTHLLDAGLNHVTVSIHGPDARLHDSLTRTRGSFAETLQALRNLSALRAGRRFRLDTSTVVTRRNLPRLRELCDLFGTLDADRHVFNVMMPDGRGDDLFDHLMPRYRDVAAAFAALVAGLEPALLNRIALVDIPPCTTECLPDSVRGYVERAFHYEQEGAVEERLGRRFRQASSSERPPLERGLLDGETRAFDRVTRTYHDALVRAKRPECARCRHERACSGVWTTYVDRLGWDEFQPVEQTRGNQRRPVRPGPGGGPNSSA